MHLFVSYSHNDIAWLKRVQVHLTPLVRSGSLDLWDDTKLQPGTEWHAEIDRAISLAGVIVLLVSADFLASEFIANHELPRIFGAAIERGAKVIPIIVGPCLVSQHEQLSRYQSVNSPERPLSAMEDHEAETTLLRLALVVDAHLRTISNEPAPQIQATPEPPQGPTSSQRQEILALVKRIQSKETLLSAAVSDALEIAIGTNDDALKGLCERELAGYGMRERADGLKPVASENVGAHRIIQFYASLEEEVNIDHFGTGTAAIDWLQSDPKRFPPIRFLYPEPISKIERDVERSTPERLLCLRMPASALVPTTSIPDAPVFLYARGEALSDVTEGLRATLTAALLQKLSM